MTLIENKIEMTHAIHQSESPMSGAMSIRVSHFDVVAILGRSDEVRLDFQVIGVGGETVGDYPSDCVNRKLRDFSRSFFIYILTL